MTDPRPLSIWVTISLVMLTTSLSACSGGLDDCGSDTDTVLERRGDTAILDVEIRAFNGA